jgi:hypothetical protein
MTDLPAELQTLSPREAEDALCIYKHQLAQIARGQSRTLARSTDARRGNRHHARARLAEADHPDGLGDRKHIPLLDRVVRGGGEPPTFRFSGAILPSRVVAARSLMRHLAASIVARRRLTSLHACLHWLRAPTLAPRIRRSGSYRGYTLIATPLAE